VIAAGLKRAGRFKEISIPTLWELSRNKNRDSIHERLRLHTKGLIRKLWLATPDRAALRSRIEALDMKDLLRQLDVWR
jgi:hypothetical protein